MTGFSRKSSEGVSGAQSCTRYTKTRLHRISAMSSGNRCFILALSPNRVKEEAEAEAVDTSADILWPCPRLKRPPSWLNLSALHRVSSFQSLELVVPRQVDVLTALVVKVRTSPQPNPALPLASAHVRVTEPLAVMAEARAWLLAVVAVLP